MLSYNELPVILVSAVDTATADAFIAELIENEVKDVRRDAAGEKDRVWRLTNKYYTAEVRLRATGDADVPLVDPEAHVVLLGPEEGEREADERWQRSGPTASVVLVAGPWHSVPAAIALWAAAHHIEPVPLLETASMTLEGESVMGVEEGAPFRESYGVRRVREALHAHPWRGLRRQRPPTGGPEPGLRPPSPPEEDIDDEDDEERCVERAEAFAKALSALGAARDLPDDDAARRQRAEDLVTAFASALGLSLADC